MREEQLFTFTFGDEEVGILGVLDAAQWGESKEKKNQVRFNTQQNSKKTNGEFEITVLRSFGL